MDFQVSDLIGLVKGELEWERGMYGSCWLLLSGRLKENLTGKVGCFGGVEGCHFYCKRKDMCCCGYSPPNLLVSERQLEV